MAVLLAALSALTFGAGDFLGGLSARRIAAQWTTAIAQATGLVLLVVLAVVVGGSPRAPTWPTAQAPASAADWR